MGGSAGADGREIRRLVNRRQETRLTKRVSRIYAPHLLSPWRGILDGFIPPSGKMWGGGDNPEIPRMIDVTGAGSRNDAHRVRLRLVNRAFERYVRYRRRRNEKNESRTVFENLEATFSELFTHTRFISRKVGFSRRCPLVPPRAAYLDPARRPAGCRSALR